MCNLLYIAKQFRIEYHQPFLQYKLHRYEEAEEAIKDMIYPDKPKEITPSLIMNVVADHFGVSIEDIVSKKRNKELVEPRQS